MAQPGAYADAFGRTAGARPRWSWPHRVFVALLAGMLVLGVLLLIVVHKVLQYAPVCVPGTPSIAQADLADRQQLGATLASVMPAFGRTFEQGTVGAKAVWTDVEPEGGVRALTAPGLRAADYEIRRWAPDPVYGARAGDDIVADAFAFPSQADAQTFFARASSAHCHRDGATVAASAPGSVRNLIWLNPDGYAQEDAFHVHANVVYRVSDVRPDSPHGPGPRWNLDGRVGTATVNRIACRLPGALCAPAGEAPRSALARGIRTRPSQSTA
jgi:hypothetical protein